MTRHDLARFIDHTALRPETTEQQIATLCHEAHRYRFASVCVMPYYLPLVRSILTDLGSEVTIGTTIGFPNGAHTTLAKVAEAEGGMRDGATELDMVMNIGAMKSGRFRVVAEDIAAVVRLAHSPISRERMLVKVILETALLDEREKELACELATEVGADFVKTSTGFAGSGATVADIRLMRRFAGPHVRIKASGGIRDYATAMAMIDAGADRIGASASIAIIEGVPEDAASNSHADPP